MSLIPVKQSDFYFKNKRMYLKNKKFKKGGLLLLSSSKCPYCKDVKKTLKRVSRWFPVFYINLLDYTDFAIMLKINVVPEIRFVNSEGRISKHKYKTEPELLTEKKFVQYITNKIKK